MKRGEKERKLSQKDKTKMMLTYRDRDAGGSLFVRACLEHILAKVFKGIDQTTLQSQWNLLVCVGKKKIVIKRETMKLVVSEWIEWASSNLTNSFKDLNKQTKNLLDQSKLMLMRLPMMVSLSASLPSDWRTTNSSVKFCPKWITPQTSPLRVASKASE